MSDARGTRLLTAGLVVVTALLAVGAFLAGPLPLPVAARLGGAEVHRVTGRLERTAALWAQLAAAPIVLFLVARLCRGLPPPRRRPVLARPAPRRAAAVLLAALVVLLVA